MKLKMLFSLLVLTGVYACSQESAVQNNMAEETPPAPQDLTALEIPDAGVVITNAHILDGMGGEIANGSVVVQDGRIVSVTDGTTDVPGALVVDAEGRTVMPGFIDAHRHIIQGDPAAWLQDEAATSMQEFLEAGFTTVFSAGDAPQILDLRRMTAEGEITGPRILAASFTGLAAPNPNADPIPEGDPARFDTARPPLRATEANPAIPDEAALAQVHRVIEGGYDAVKNVINVSPDGPEERTLSLMVEEAHANDMRVVTHAVTVIDTLAAVRAGVDTLVHTPHIGMLTDEEVQFIADSGIPMVSTLGIFVPFYDENNEPIFRDALPFPWETISSAGQGPVNARLLWEAGVVYGYGTDTRYNPELTLKHELKSLFLVFSEQDILQIMGRNAAITINMQDQIGTLESGKLADIVFVDGDPTSDLFDLLNVSVVMKNGDFVVDKR